MDRMSQLLAKANCYACIFLNEYHSRLVQGNSTLFNRAIRVWERPAHPKYFRIYAEMSVVRSKKARVGTKYICRIVLSRGACICEMLLHRLHIIRYRANNISSRFCSLDIPEDENRSCDKHCKEENDICC
jgi:hypothetical protein